MTFDTHVAAIAALTLDVPATSKSPLYRREVAAGAIVSRYADGHFDFAFHAIARLPSAFVQRWGDRLIADDPLLVGYRLGRTSRLLCDAGFDRNIAATFTVTGRVELVDEVIGAKTPLSATAVLNDVMAIDQQALVHATRPIANTTGASLALINAAASWVIWFRRSTGNVEARTLREEGLTQFRAQVRDSGDATLIAAIDPTVQ